MHASYVAMTQRKEDVLFSGSRIKKDNATQTNCYDTISLSDSRTRSALFSHLLGYQAFVQSSLHFVEPRPLRFFSHKTPRARSATLKL